MPKAPGILTVTLHRAVGLPTPDEYNQYPKREHDHKHDHNPFGEKGWIYCECCNIPYALLNYDKSEVEVKCYYGTTANPRWLGQDDGSCKFDVTRFTDLSISFYLCDPKKRFDAKEATEIYLKPFDLLSKCDTHWLQLEDGMGKIQISFEYVNVSDETLKDADFDGASSPFEMSNSGYLQVVKKKDTRQKYVEKLFTMSELISQSEVTRALPSRASHPFIASVTVQFQSEYGLCLLSPYAGGGYLFNYIQKQRSFDVHRSQLYMAEILCALEYVHGKHNVYGWLKPRTVHLDLSGHIVLCGFGLFISEIKHRDRSTCGMPEYPAPELILAQDEVRMADWWTLGIFLYEMLTGFPPFYDENPDNIEEKILNQTLHFPEPMPSAAMDIITKLLDRRPEQRLGANGGAAEIKTHEFFHGIDWEKVFLRKYKPAFKPYYVTANFKQHGVRKCLEPREPSSSCSDALDALSSENFRILMKMQDEPSLIHQTATQTNKEWELVWEDSQPQQFHFYNPVTGEKRSIPPRSVDHSELRNAAIDSTGGYTIPSQSQMLDTLEAALQAGHDRAISQLLEYGVDLNVLLFGEDKKVHYAGL